MVNPIVAGVASAVAAASVIVPVALGRKSTARKDTIRCQTVGEYLGPAIRGKSPDYAAIRRQQTRDRIMGGKTAQPR